MVFRLLGYSVECLHRSSIASASSAFRSRAGDGQTRHRAAGPANLSLGNLECLSFVLYRHLCFRVYEFASARVLGCIGVTSICPVCTPANAFHLTCSQTEDLRPSLLSEGIRPAASPPGGQTSRAGTNRYTLGSTPPLTPPIHVFRRPAAPHRFIK